MTPRERERYAAVYARCHVVVTRLRLSVIIERCRSINTSAICYAKMRSVMICLCRAAAAAARVRDAHMAPLLLLGMMLLMLRAPALLRCAPLMLLPLRQHAIFLPMALRWRAAAVYRALRLRRCLPIRYCRLLPYFAASRLFYFCHAAAFAIRRLPPFFSRF